MENLLNVKQVADLLGVSRATIYEWCSRRQIPHLKVGRRTAFDPEEIKQWLNVRRRADIPNATDIDNSQNPNEQM